MAAENWFADTMTATVETEDSSPVSVPVGSFKQVTISAEADHVELYSADTIEREQVNKRAFKVNVNAGVAAFDNTFIEEWLGGDGPSSTSLTDDNSVATFDLEGSITSAAGTTYTATVTGLYFPTLPIMDAQEGAWVQHNYQGTGSAVSISTS
jgi:hypothetical protein